MMRDSLLAVWTGRIITHTGIHTARKINQPGGCPEAAAIIDPIQNKMQVKGVSGINLSKKEFI